MLNYDTAGVPEFDARAGAAAEKLGLRPIHVICDEPDSKPGDATAVSFFAFVAFVPRIGETIKLDDGKQCRVCDVAYKTFRVNDDYISMIPNVVAERIQPTTSLP